MRLDSLVTFCILSYLYFSLSLVSSVLGSFFKFCFCILSFVFFKILYSFFGILVSWFFVF